MVLCTGKVACTGKKVVRKQRFLFAFTFYLNCFVNLPVTRETFDVFAHSKISANKHGGKCVVSIEHSPQG